MIRLNVAIFCSILSIFCLLAFAEAQGIPLLPESSADYTFGQELRFLIEAHNASDVERITLQFRPELSTNNYEVNVPFEPGDTISATFAVDTNTLNLVPFRDVSYSWVLHTNEKSQTVPEQRFTYLDNRFDWSSTSDGEVIAHWTGDEPEMGQLVLDTMDLALDRFLGIVSVNEVGPLEIYVYPTTADLRTALSLTGIEGSRTAQLETNVVLVTSVNPQTAESDLAQSIPYELAQLVLFRVAGRDLDSIPWWLKEGIAVRAQLAGNPRYDQLLESAVQTGRTIPLRELCVTPIASGDMLLLASAQSASLLDFMVSEHSPAVTNQMLSAYLSGADCEAGIEGVLGQTMDEIEHEWLLRQSQSSPARQFFSTYAIWLLLLLAGTGLVAILLIATRSKERPKRTNLREG